MKTVIISFNHKTDNEIYRAEEGAKKLLEYLKEGFPIRASFYDKDSGVLSVRFGSKGAILLTEDEEI